MQDKKNSEKSCIKPSTLKYFFSGLAGEIATCVAVKVGFYDKQITNRVNCMAGEYEVEFANSYHCNSTLSDSCYKVTLACVDPENMTAIMNAAQDYAKRHVEGFANITLQDWGLIISTTIGGFLGGMAVYALVKYTYKKYCNSNKVASIAVNDDYHRLPDEKEISLLRRYSAIQSNPRGALQIDVQRDESKESKRLHN